MLEHRLTAKTRLMAAAAAVLIGFPCAGSAQTVITKNHTSGFASASEAAAPLEGGSIVGFSQVRRRNSGPALEEVQPEQPAAPAATETTEEDGQAGLSTLRRNRPGGETGAAPTEGEGGGARPRAGDQPSDNGSGWERATETAEIEEAAEPAPQPYIRPGGQFLLSDNDLLTGERTNNRGLRDPERRRPGNGPFVEEPAPYVDPTAVPLPPPRAAGPDDFLAIPDRWRLVDTLGIIKENPLDPYDQNTLKGDKPIWEGNCFPFLKPLTGDYPTDCFLILVGISDTVVEPRSFPTPTGVQTTNDPSTDDLFGDSDQIIFNQNFIHGFSFVNGDTAFRPQDIEFRYTGILNGNFADVSEQRVLRVSPSSGTNRLDWHYSVIELFVDYHIANISDRYDFYSVRAGIQPFSSDFRGFVFQDSQLGLRFFGNWDNNLWQYNLAWFRKLEKDTNSGLNDVFKSPREDDIFIANVYRQDFPILGLTSQFTGIYNRNREGDSRFFDDNGFLARPASFGSQRGRDYDAFYLGYNVDGRIGRINLTGSAYYLFGRDDNIFTDESANISAYFAAAEVSIDYDWTRWRLSALYASGDSDPFDNTQGGFDAIFENPQFAGGDTSYWIRQQIPLIGAGGGGLSSRNAVIPSLRTSKEHGQNSFVSPGIILVGAGADFDLTPTFRLSGNVNYMWFDNTSSLELLRLQKVDDDIGLDVSAAAIWRPFQTQNFVFRLSGAVLFPGQGFNDLFAAQGNRDFYYSVLANLILTY